MRSHVRWLVPGFLLAICATGPAWGYVEAPYTLGKVIADSTNVVLVKVTRVQKEKGLIIFRKVKDLKGTYDGDQLRHNIGSGDRGFHPRESKHVMTWAAVGQQAVFFCNEEASETCIGTYWYQCYREDSGGACRTPSRTCCGLSAATPTTWPREWPRSWPGKKSSSRAWRTPIASACTTVREDCSA